jgi:tetratricopeptide (TPR) repeat protein
MEKAILSVLLVFFIFQSLKTNSLYTDDVKYWEEMNEMTNRQNNVVKLNLSKAYLKARRFDLAKKMLFHLKYENENHGLIDDIINTELGEIYFAHKKYKLAGYYFLKKPKKCFPGADKIAKERLKKIGDFLFAIGFLSYAENRFACDVVLDPYDIELLKRLGKVLIYKNFFRAAGKYFEKVLEYDENNDSAIYYLAFISKMIGDKERYDIFQRKWKKITNNRADIDFQEIYDHYGYDKVRIQEYLSSDPVSLFLTGKTRFDYLYKYKGKVYNFWEVPLEIGRYFYNQKKYETSINYLLYAHKLNKKDKEIIEYLIKNYRALNDEIKVEKYTKILAEMERWGESS